MARKKRTPHVFPEQKNYAGNRGGEESNLLYFYTALVSNRDQHLVFAKKKKKNANKIRCVTKGLPQFLERELFYKC